MTDLAALIEKLEKAEKGNRQLDADIFRYWVVHESSLFRMNGEETEVNVSHFIPGRDPDWRWQPIHECAPYTTSLDAALTLVDPDWWLSMSHRRNSEGEKRCFVGLEIGPPNYIAGSAAHSFPIALVIAALKARAS